MSREFPFINDDAEGLRDGNKAFEGQFSAGMVNEDFIDVRNYEKSLALSESVERYPSRGDLWDLSSVRSLGQNGSTHFQ